MPPARASHRAVAVEGLPCDIEIDSPPNLVTNTCGQPCGTAMCETVKANGAYVNGVGYALANGAIRNVYNYIDAADHGWIGWDSNFGPTDDQLLAAATASGSTGRAPRPGTPTSTVAGSTGGSTPATGATRRAWVSAPEAGIDAYVWVKPPGESDGSSSLIPNNEGKGFDRMCDPTYTGNARKRQQQERRVAQRADLRCLVLRAVPGAHGDAYQAL
jgi:cellulase/cellobiase CelA1